MGLIHVTVELREKLKSKKKFAADFLVDMGATDSLAPAKHLRKAGIKPIGKMTYELADGSLVEYEFAVVFIEFLGEITGGRVIFGPDDAEPLLGVTALESVGILVDPKNHRLKRLPAISLKELFWTFWTPKIGTRESPKSNDRLSGKKVMRAAHG
jgi:clan AA aspartic protease